jgi:hypothetical protein
LGNNGKSTKPRNKGTFLGVYVEDGHIDKIAAVERKFDEAFGEEGRNRSRAIRYILDCFDTDFLEHFPKSLASASATAQMGMGNTR